VSAPVDAAVLRELRDLGVNVPPGTKRAVVLERVQAKVIRVVTTAPGTFSRRRFDRLMALHAVLQDAPEVA
jgi:hypothetical protein